MAMLVHQRVTPMKSPSFRRVKPRLRRAQIRLVEVPWIEPPAGQPSEFLWKSMGEAGEYNIWVCLKIGYIPNEIAI